MTSTVADPFRVVEEVLHSVQMPASGPLAQKIVDALAEQGLLNERYDEDEHDEED